MKFLVFYIFIILFTDFAYSTQNTLVRFSGGEPRTLDTARADDTPGMQVLQDLFEGLTRADREGKAVLAAAQSVEKNEAGTLYTFHLRPSALWSDGSPVSASDCALGISRLFDPKVAAPNAMTGFVIKNSRLFNAGKIPMESLGVHALDKSTLQILLEYPLPQFLDLLTSVNFACAKSKNYDLKGNLRLDHLVTNGAYTLVSQAPGESIILAKNTHYYDAQNVAISRVKYFTTEDREAQVRMILSGGAQLSDTHVPSQMLPYLKKNVGDNLKIGPAAAVLFLHLNTSRPPFLGNRALRQSLSMGIDREALAKYILGDGETPAYDLVPNSIDGYKPYRYPWSFKARAQQIQEAKKLLAEAGYSPERPLSITLKYNTNPDLKKIVVAIGSMLEKNLGVHVHLENMEFRAFLNDIETAQYEVSINAWNATYLDPSQFTDLLQSENPQNLSHMKDPIYDHLLRQAQLEKDFKKRMKIIEEASKKGMENYTIIPLVNQVNKSLISPKLKGFTIKDPLWHLYSRDFSF